MPQCFSEGGRKFGSFVRQRPDELFRSTEAQYVSQLRAQLLVVLLECDARVEQRVLDRRAWRGARGEVIEDCARSFGVVLGDPAANLRNRTATSRGQLGSELERVRNVAAFS